MAEAFVLKHVDGLFHFHDEDAIRVIRENYGYKAPAMQGRPGCMDEFRIRPGHPKLSKADGGIHIVYAAGLARLGADPAKVGPSAQYHDFVQVVEQGLHLHVYIAYRKSEDRESGLVQYFELADRYPNFHIEDTLPYGRLMDELTRYDYAYCHFPKRGSRRFDEFFGFITNNFYTYMDAGLPVICSPDTFAVADIVKRYGLGVVAKDVDVPRLGEILKNLDVSMLSSNIEAATPNLLYKHDKILAFITSIMDPTDRKAKSRFVTTKSVLS